MSPYSSCYSCLILSCFNHCKFAFNLLSSIYVCMMVRNNYSRWLGYIYTHTHTHIHTCCFMLFTYVCYVLFYFQVHNYLLYVMLRYVMLYFQIWNYMLHVISCHAKYNCCTSCYAMLLVILTCHVTSFICHFISHNVMSRVQSSLQKNIFKSVESFTFITTSSAKMRKYPNRTPLFMLEYLN